MLVPDANEKQRTTLPSFAYGVLRNEQVSKELLYASAFTVIPLNGIKQAQNISHQFDVVRQLRLRVVSNASTIEHTTARIPCSRQEHLSITWCGSPWILHAASTKLHVF
jgi:hypothetical protein